MSAEESDDRIGLDAAIASLTSDDEKCVKSEIKNADLPGVDPEETKNLSKRKLVSVSEDPEILKVKVPKVDVGSSSSSDVHSNLVATHYNELKTTGIAERANSRIFYMRNFNNWIKSMLISEYLDKVKANKKIGAPLRVLDMCCGKGGDLKKFCRHAITHLICTDIACVSVEQCETRYKDMKSRGSYDRNMPKLFSAEFITADCTSSRLREKYCDPSVELDLVSCQFAFHYSFESLPQAECMLRNAAECLRDGGYFIGTIPNAYEIMKRKQEVGSDKFGNDVYSIEFQHDESEATPLFGGKYMFYLDGVVNCSEFLVHFPTLVKLAEKFGLELVSKLNFREFFDTMREKGRMLLGKTQSFETYPPFKDTELTSTTLLDYEHAKEYLSKKTIDDKKPIGTLSKSEWDATSLYLAFAFKKVKTVWNAEGKPEFQNKKKEV